MILIFSLAVNFAFAGVWMYHRFYLSRRSERPRWEHREDGDRRRHRDKDRDWHRDDGDGFEKKLPGLLGRDRQHWKEVGKLRHALMQEHQKLFDLLSDEKTDREAVDECLNRIADLRDQMQRGVVEHVLSVKKELGPEQSEKLMHFLRKKALGPGGRGRHRPGPGRGPDSRRRHEDEGCRKRAPFPFPSFGWNPGLFSWEAR